MQLYAVYMGLWDCKEVGGSCRITIAIKENMKVNPRMLEDIAGW